MENLFALHQGLIWDNDQPNIISYITLFNRVISKAMFENDQLYVMYIALFCMKFLSALHLAEHAFSVLLYRHMYKRVWSCQNMI